MNLSGKWEDEITCLLSLEGVRSLLNPHKNIKLYLRYFPKNTGRLCGIFLTTTLCGEDSPLICSYMYVSSFLSLFFTYQYDFHFFKQPVSLKLQLRVHFYGQLPSVHQSVVFCFFFFMPSKIQRCPTWPHRSQSIFLSTLFLEWSEKSGM